VKGGGGATIIIIFIIISNIPYSRDFHYNFGTWTHCADEKELHQEIKKETTSATLTYSQYCEKHEKLIEITIT